MELERFRRMGEELGQFPRLGEDVFHRPNRKPPIEKRWREMDITQLAMSYQDSVVRARKRSTILKKETVSLTSKIEHFKQRLRLGGLTAMRDLIDLGERPEVVVTFLASLELSRLKKLKLHQNETYAPIYLELMESLENFDTKLASGFDSITDQVQAELGLAAAGEQTSGEPQGSDQRPDSGLETDAGSIQSSADSSGMDLATHDFFGDQAQPARDSASDLGAGTETVPAELLRDASDSHERSSSRS
jgi:hypothetical protein